MKSQKGSFRFNGYPSGKHVLVERTESNWFVFKKKVLKREFKLNGDFVCSFLFKGYYYEITIKKGFIYDGASIPKFAWSILGSPFTGLYLEAATVHDAIYYAVWKYGRKLADEIFLFIMLEMGVPRAKAYTMYKTVRMGGSSSFKKRKNIDVSKFLIVKRTPEVSQRLSYGKFSRTKRG